LKEITKDWERLYRKNKPSRINIALSYMVNKEFRAVYLYRQRRTQKMSKHFFRYHFWAGLNHLLVNNLYIDDKTDIAEGLLLIHAFGIAIAAKQIGKNCTIFHNVTIGPNYRNDQHGNRLLPVLGDNVIISPGAVVVGNCKIGSNVLIGANSVITKDCPDNSVVFGYNQIHGAYDKARFG
jgi:serine O-acetyltransferase